MTDVMPDTQQIAQWLKVLAEPRRLAIVQMLMQGTCCNCEISAQLGLAANLVSHHTTVLREAGLVTTERDAEDARWIYVAINRPALAELHAALGAFFDPARIQERVPQCGPRPPRSR
ncbi:winged helix-turn-helix transcriptional regulator [Chloroflexia bacterium SDU3-3]|nr:winged helix-turn-helix transcriptional regulator [Chloroflexia bacterium SDU3-3]